MSPQFATWVVIWGLFCRAPDCFVNASSKSQAGQRQNTWPFSQAGQRQCNLIQGKTSERPSVDRLEFLGRTREADASNIAASSGTIERTGLHDGPEWNRVVVRRRKTWDHHMELQAAVAMDAPVTAQAVVFLQQGADAMTAVVVGDNAGGVSMFQPSGQLLTEFQTGDGAVTAISAVLTRHQHLTLLTGHINGRVHTHTVTLAAAKAQPANDSAISSAGRLMPQLQVTSIVPSQMVLGLPVLAITGSAAVTVDSGEPPDFDASPVRHLLTMTSKQNLRFAAILDSGRIAVWSHKGDLLQGGFCPHQVLAARWSEASIAMITPHGGAVFPTHAYFNASMSVVQTKECEGLGISGTLLAAATFDVQRSVHVYGCTATTGRLLHIFLGNAKTFMNCRVLFVQKLMLGPPSRLAASGVTMVSTHQHVIAAGTTGVAVWEVRQRTRPPINIFTDSIGAMKSSIMMQGLLEKAPLLAAGRQGPVAVGFDAGVIAIYLPIHLHFEGHRDFTAFEAWIRPVLGVAMLMAVAIQISRARRRARRRHQSAASEHGTRSDSTVNSRPPRGLLRGGLRNFPASEGPVRAAGRLPSPAAPPSDVAVAFGSDVTMRTPLFVDHPGHSDIGGTPDESKDDTLAGGHAELTRLMATASIRERVVRHHMMRDFR